MKITSPALHSSIELLELRLAPAGIVSVSTAGGILTLTGDNFSNVIEINPSGFGDWDILDPGATGTMFSLNGAAPLAALAVPILQSVKITLNGGDDQLTLNNLAINNTLNILGNDGVDTISLSGLQVNGITSMDTGNGADVFTQSNSIFTNTYTLKTGGGVDSVQISGAVGFFGRGMTVDLGTDGNTFSLDVTELDVFGSLNVSATGALAAVQNFTLAAADGFVSGSVVMKNTTGASSMSIGNVIGDSLRITGGLTLQGAAGNDSFILNQNLTVGGALTILSGAGSNAVQTFNLANLKAGSLVYTGGADSDTFTLNGVNVLIGGNATFNGGAGSNSFNVSTVGAFRVGGSLAYIGGIASDTAQITTADAFIGGLFSYNGGNGSNLASFAPTNGTAGSINFTGGTGTDIFDVGNYLGTSVLVKVLGNVSLNSGTGSSFITTNDANIFGSYTVNSMAGAASADQLTVDDSSFHGAVIVNLAGDALAQVDFDDVFASTTVSISTGGGNDTVRLDASLVAPTIRSNFIGTVRVLLGAGNDSFEAGDFSSTLNVGCNFFSTIFVDGGTGADTADYIAPAFNNFFNVPVTAAHRPGVETFN